MAPPHICVASHHDSFAALLADADFVSLATEPGVLVELRVDNYHDASHDALRQALAGIGPQRCVVTVRARDEGGGDRVADIDRPAFLATAAQAGAAYVDIELATLRAQPDLAKPWQTTSRRPTRRIVSTHDFNAVPPLAHLRAQRRAAEALGADVVKLAVMPTTMLDSLPLLHLLHETDWSRPLLALAMGDVGLWSRVLTARFAMPAPLTFARATGFPGTAAGQPTLTQLRNDYGFAAINTTTPVYGVMGNPIGHSLSPQVHHAALRACGLPGVYLSWRVAAEPLRFVQEMAPLLGIVGLSVTLPHKEAVLPACRQLAGLAQHIGAVNTLIAPQGGTWVGYNTDAAAAAEPLARTLNGLQGRTVWLLGAGGAARAVAFALRQAGARVLIYNRHRDRALALAAAVGAEVLTDIDHSDGPVDAVVNTTPAGMAPHIDAMPMPAESIPTGAVVFDTIYNPRRTRWLDRAAQRGHPVIEGLTMFVEQAAAQFHLFTGVEPPRAVMQACAEAALQGLSR